MRILGIDPGIGICGFGLIETTSRAGARALDFGAVTTTVDAPLPARLKELYDSLSEVFEETKPEMVAVEKLFFAKNITTGIAVAEARGIVLLVAEQHGLSVYEYTPNEIKKSLTGYGAATKLRLRKWCGCIWGLSTNQSRMMPQMRWRWQLLVAFFINMAKIKNIVFQIRVVKI